MNNAAHGELQSICTDQMVKFCRHVLYVIHTHFNNLNESEVSKTVKYQKLASDIFMEL